MHDLSQHLASAGERTKQGKSVYEDLASLTFYRYTHSTNLPQALLPMFLFGTVEKLSPFFTALGPIVWSLLIGTWHLKYSCMGIS